MLQPPNPPQASSSPPRSRRLTLSSGIVLAIAAVCALLIGLDLWRTSQTYQNDLAQSVIVNRNLARVLAEQTRGVIRSVEIVLTGLRGRVETENLFDNASTLLRPVVRMRAREIPMIHEIYAWNAAGRPMLGEAKAETNSQFAENLLQVHSADTARRAYVGRPSQDPRSGAWVISVSQRIDTPTGRLAGIVVATIALADLQPLFASVDAGPRGVIAVVADDGTIVARQPPPGNQAAPASARPLAVSPLPRNNGDVYAYTSAIDSVERIGSMARINEYGFTVMVAPARDEILADWWLDARIHFVVCLVVAVLLWMLGAWLVSQVAARTKAEQHYRMLAENSDDGIVSFTADGALLYVSPAYATLIGRTVAECDGMNMDEIVHPADRVTYMPLDGEIRQGSASIRYVCKNGSHIWVEGSTRRAANTAGQPPHYVASIRDISERMEAERRIADLNHELAAQASTDGLTGVANRRRFDEALASEWRRSAREALPLSLLILDVDAFKRFNDHYGHVLGDQCLRNVARALGGTGRRPADLVARYGGEEFVVLLPNTDQAGAILLAESARASIEAEAIQHAASPFHDVVTCSVGYATLYPRPDDPANSQDQLVSIADAALYAAKHAGRNRVGHPTTPDAPTTDGLQTLIPRLTSASA